MQAAAKYSDTASLGARDGKARVLLIVSMGSMALGAMVVAAGMAKLFLQLPPLGSWWLIGCGLPVVVAGTGGVLHTLRVLPEPTDDCERYGRHIVGLTFLLLVIGLCNAVGTSTLAFDGGLGFSASALLKASDPKQVEDAEKRREAARTAVESRQRELEIALRSQARAQQRLTAACAVVAAAPAGSPQVAGADACELAREQASDSEDDVFARRSLVTDAKDAQLEAQQTCDAVRSECRRALFFLLSLSTMMSLFGASFYVVNRVRSKRPRKKGTFAPLDEVTPFDADPESAGTAGTAVAIAEAGQNAPAVAVANARPMSDKNAHVEPFDVHAFWSGGFFRVGEAVLFTFAFFWLIWTSDRRTDVIWLPVLGLFVGMFVKTGEAIIFRLGMRVLSAVEALLPSALPASPTAPATSQSPPAPGKPRASDSPADEGSPPSRAPKQPAPLPT